MRAMTLHLGPHDVALQPRNLTDAGIDGATFAGELRIVLHEGLDGSRLSETLVHEALHLVAESNGIEICERDALSLGLGLAQLLAPFLNLGPLTGPEEAP